MTDPDPIDIHIGRRAAIRRQTLGLSTGDVAQALGVNETAVYDLERGASRVEARQLWVWSSLLQVPMAWFFRLSTEASHRTTHMVFVPNPDFDWPGQADPTTLN